MTEQLSLLKNQIQLTQKRDPNHPWRSPCGLQRHRGYVTNASVFGLGMTFSSRWCLPEQVLKSQALISMDRAPCGPEAKTLASPKEAEVLSAGMLTRCVPEQSPGSACVCCCCSDTQLCLTLCNPMDCSPQNPLPMGFLRQECCSGNSAWRDRSPFWNLFSNKKKTTIATPCHCVLSTSLTFLCICFYLYIF